MNKNLEKNKDSYYFILFGRNIYCEFKIKNSRNG